MSAEILHLLFTAAGVALGYYIKHQSIRLPPNVVTVLHTLLETKAHQDAHGLLNDLLGGAAASAPPAVPPKS